RQEFVLARNLLGLCGKQLDIDTSQQYRTSLKDAALDIAVVLPLSGELQAFGEDIYNGAVIAADFYRQENNAKVNFTTYDTKGDPINAARIIRDLANAPVDIILGPLTSEEAAVASATLSCSNLPLLAPAATQTGLTALSATSFQLSPNIELQGIQMADYAVNRLSADTAAIITSTSTDDLLMSRAFAERFKKLGGDVIAVEYYRSRDKDFSKYIKDIKAMLLGAHPDSVIFINERGDTLDADGLPAHVDCLFLPGKASQLRLLLAQINFYNLNGFYLGSDGWGDDEVYRLGDDVTKGAVFPSPFIPGINSDEKIKFSGAYDSRFAVQPPRLAALGYDAVRIITLAAQRAGTDRESLVKELSQIQDYTGAAGKVNFNRSRENNAMPVFKIENEQAVLLGVGETASDSTPESVPQQKE
ncbi:MAG: penicillin-binding protein activator, partial [Candidatus Zixiibacteriota bacterium]